MHDLMDDFARILATPMPRRRAFKLFGGALAAAIVAAVGVQPVSAKDCTKQQLSTGMKTCGSGTNSTCCAAGTCCAVKGTVVSCCQKSQCVCSNGMCAASNAGSCPAGCTKCNG